MCVVLHYSHVLILIKQDPNPHLEILLDLHQLLQDPSVSRVLLTHSLLQAIHPSS